jgi:hypothetical protein
MQRFAKLKTPVKTLWEEPAAGERPAGEPQPVGSS